jgi:DNA-binding transcriptional MerR regulator
MGRQTPSTQDAFSGSRAAKLAGISYRCLDYWTWKRLITPSIARARGSGRYRLYSPLDILALRVAKGLREEGLSLRTIQKALARLDGDGQGQRALTSRRFLVQKGHLLVMDGEAGTAIDVSANGQLLLSVVLDVLGGPRPATPTRKPLSKATRRSTRATLLASAASL